MAPKVAPTGTKILVRVVDVRRALVPDVLIEILGRRGSLNPDKSDNPADGVLHPGEKTWTIAKDEFGGADSIKLFIRARKPNSDFGPVPQGDPPDWSKFTPGIADTTMILVLGQDDFIEILLYDRAAVKCVAALPMPTGQRQISRFSPPDFEIPARDLTLDQARAILDFLHLNGQITLQPVCAPTLNPATCAVTQTKASNVNVSLRARPYGVRIIMNSAGSSIVDASNPTSTQGVFSMPEAATNIDVRAAVALVRMIRFLRDAFGIAEFLHAGIGQGKGGFDCHSEGRAVDFVGVRMPDPAVATGTRLVYVLDTWGGKGVPKEAGLGTAFDSPTRRPLDPSWPLKTFTKLEYRLRSHVDLPGPPPVPLSAAFQVIRGFWEDVFKVVAHEYRSNADNNQKIGESGFIMHPDFPKTDTFEVPATKDNVPVLKPDGTPVMIRVNGSSGREAHLAHLHFQIGDTTPEMPCTGKFRPGKTAIEVHGRDCIHDVRSTC